MLTKQPFGLLVKLSARKRRLIRVIDAIARPMVRLLMKLGYCPARVATEVRSILLLEYWNLGDIVMESPFIQNVRTNYPNARIVCLLTSPKAAPLIEGQGLVNEVITVRVPWAQHYSRWRKSRTSFLTAVDRIVPDAKILTCSAFRSCLQRASGHPGELHSVACGDPQTCRFRVWWRRLFPYRYCDT